MSEKYKIRSTDWPYFVTPWNSNYAFSENRVIDGVELEGLEYESANGEPKGPLNADYAAKNGMTLEKGMQNSNSNPIEIKPTNSSTLETTSTINGYLSISASAIENLGGLDKAQKLIESGKFETVYNGATKQWKLNFNGNQYVDPDFDKAAKTSHIAKASKGMTALKVVKAGGVVFNIAGLGFTGVDIDKNGLNISNGSDAVMGGVAFIPGVGWATSGGYFGIKMMLDGKELKGDDKLHRELFIQENEEHIPQGINIFNEKY